MKIAILGYGVEGESIYRYYHALQQTLRDEVLSALMRIRPNDVVARVEEDHETELTRLAESAVERGVNEITNGELNRDSDFSINKKSVQSENKVKNDARKKKKAHRQNRKKNRK